jgi:AcrR family transcriptional regulator
MKMSRVKPERRARRRYDARGRREQAQANREAMLAAAQRAFLELGYGGTTVAVIAHEAGVSVETVYKGFGGKPGLVRALVERGLAGGGPVPAEERSNAISAREPDPHAIVEAWGGLAAEVSPRVAPILLVARDASRADADLALVLESIDARRLDRMRDNARLLKRRGFLRVGVTVEKAADVMWTLVSPEIYELLVVRRGWTAARFGAFIASTLRAALLPARPRSRSR